MSIKDTDLDFTEPPYAPWFFDEDDDEAAVLLERGLEDEGDTE